MMCYKDMTFCSAPCMNFSCERKLTRQVHADAQQWWDPKGEDPAPIAVADLREGCPGWQPAYDTSKLISRMVRT